MMRRSLITALFCAMTIPNAFAGEARTELIHPEKFTDIRNVNESAEDAQARVGKEFSFYFSDLAKKLPNGYTLEVQITDIDLAGSIRYNFARTMRDIRVLKDIDWPKMSLSYTLKNPQQEVIASGKEELRDMYYLSKANLSTSSYKYEEQMLKDWFRHMQHSKVFPSREQS
ncbi:DUF3016 domain-containing protein [Undibacterium sp. Jales W-56]|uniref:DUF3016 domain-containing protein n=1 Tax=Undibacterium sp. Jales W-56 TaxID=2897325 RepID=UPI0021D359C8|nr:DUF3016 domain-containing protein [Undibacterium sp. Jales W-56]MCU6432504.1 DUF3016 domain-containing protein [Undibacterium sp. Jales W-56]